jgi:hypothetical protein
VFIHLLEVVVLPEGGLGGEDDAINQSGGQERGLVWGRGGGGGVVGIGRGVVAQTDGGKRQQLDLLQGDWFCWCFLDDVGG